MTRGEKLNESMDVEKKQQEELLRQSEDSSNQENEAEFAKYCRILGVSEDATQDQIKAAYRKLTLKYHPDRSKDKSGSASEEFLEIKKAYEFLSELGDYKSPFTRITKAYNKEFMTFYEPMTCINGFFISGILDRYLIESGMFKSEEEMIEYYESLLDKKEMIKEEWTLKQKEMLDEANELIWSLEKCEDLKGKEEFQFDWKKLDEWFIKLFDFFEKYQIPVGKKELERKFVDYLDKFIKNQSDFTGEMYNDTSKEEN